MINTIKHGDLFTVRKESKVAFNAIANDVLMFKYFQSSSFYDNIFVFYNISKNEQYTWYMGEKLFFCDFEKIS